ncbi:hypothetical protein BAC1_01004 [uncultured bacterium]|nr:hypothetical protein BAC1_01004 [uncultured bacterium]
MKRLFAAAVLSVLGLSSNAYSQPVNFGFEAGSTSGWVETFPNINDGQINVVTSWSWEDVPLGTDERISAEARKPSYSPVEGNYFAVLKTGVTDTKYTTLSQSFSLSGGDVLEGWASFFGPSEVGYPYQADNGNYNDYALITINRRNNVIAVPWYADSIDHGYIVTTAPGVNSDESVNFGNLPWQYWSWTAPAPDFYTLNYHVTQDTDTVQNSYAFFDGPRKLTAVPEPSSMALIGLSIAGVFAAHHYSRLDKGNRLA